MKGSFQESAALKNVVYFWKEVFGFFVFLVAVPMKWKEINIKITRCRQKKNKLQQ